jgi:hypothetical protein
VQPVAVVAPQIRSPLPPAMRTICHLLQERMLDVIPSSENQLIRFLYAVRHVERRPSMDTRRGRPSRWSREDLMEAADQLRGILERETHGRVSVNSFIGQCLSILQFPSDVTGALTSGQINLQEAAQLARLTPERIGCYRKEAREDILREHLALQGLQTRLRARVKEFPGETRQKLFLVKV